MELTCHEMTSVSAVLSEVMECNYLRGCAAPGDTTTMAVRENSPLKVLSVRGSVLPVDFKGTTAAWRTVLSPGTKANRECVITLEDGFGTTWTLSLVYERANNLDLRSLITPLYQHEVEMGRAHLIYSSEHIPPHACMGEVQSGLDRDGCVSGMLYSGNRWVISVSNSAGLFETHDFIRAIRFYLVPHLSRRRELAIKNGTWQYHCESFEQAFDC